ncbi:MAG: nitrile hydratase subunit beta [Alphaproteobacteria bacterium]|nr:nitrile hydratase subunit beta [Alphaproteobacteria bacterium]
MDGPHDLGGKEGFGPVVTDEADTPFHHDWEGRMWGISRSGAGAPGVTIDWWRHVRELIDPVDYLTRPYFDSWAQTELATYINAGVITLDEVRSGHSATQKDREARVQSVAEAIAQDASQGTDFSRIIDAAPALKVGDHVRTLEFTQQHHTRLPGYARGKPGLIHAHHGAHIFPDESAKGHEMGQHLYSVVFDAKNLWPEAGDKRDRVYLDLWESYLEPL